MKPLREAIGNLVIGEENGEPGMLVGYYIADAILEHLPILQRLYDRYTCVVCGAEMSDLDVYLGELCVLCREDDERGTIPHIAPTPHLPTGMAA